MTETPQALQKATVLHPNDWFLENLVKLVNDRNLEISVTVSTGGLLVSGLMVGGKAYFEKFGEVLASAFPDAPETAEEVRTSYAKIGELYDTLPEDAPPPIYIHIRNAFFYMPGSDRTPTNHGVLWRGRLSEISGFNLGSLTR